MTHSSSSGPSENVSNQSSNHNYNDEINIRLKVKKTVSLKMTRSDPIRKLKVLSFKHGGVSQSLQTVTFNGQILQDSKTLADYNIVDDSTVKVEFNTLSEFARKYSVKIATKDRVVQICAREDDTVHELKLIVVFMEEFVPFKCDVMLNGRYLKDHQKLSSLNLAEDDVLLLVPSPRDVVSVRVSIYSRGTHTIQVRKCQTIGELKLLLTSMTDAPLKGAKLFFGGKRLHDSRTIRSYNIGNNDLLDLITSIQVHVDVSTGGSTMVDVFPTDESRKVIVKARRKMERCLDNRPLFFNGERLEEHVPLASYGVQNGSVILIGPVTFPSANDNN